MNLAKLQRFNNKLFRNHIPFLPKLIYGIQFVLYNSSVPPSTKIGSGTKFAYLGIGCVLHGRAQIGENCILGQGITIGGRNKNWEVPTIGNNCYIGAGSRILGSIKIGDNVIIGPNSVVLIDIPSDSIAVGVPARIIKSGIKDIHDYI